METDILDDADVFGDFRIIKRKFKAKLPPFEVYEMYFVQQYKKVWYLPFSGKKWRDFKYWDDGDLKTLKAETKSKLITYIQNLQKKI
jgi:uncharacterized membrane protein YukC